MTGDLSRVVEELAVLLEASRHRDVDNELIAKMRVALPALLTLARSAPSEVEMGSVGTSPSPTDGEGAVAPSSDCTNPDHDLYPYYGVAPHECFWKKGPEFVPGQITLLPRDQWPDNFVLEVEDGEDPATITYPSACGVYYCPTCKEGMPDAGFAPEARATAQPILSAEGAHEGCEATEKPTEQEARAFARTVEKTA